VRSAADSHRTAGRNVVRSPTNKSSRRGGSLRDSAGIVAFPDAGTASGMRLAIGAQLPPSSPGHTISRSRKRTQRSRPSSRAPKRLRTCLPSGAAVAFGQSLHPIGVLLVHEPGGYLRDSTRGIARCGGQAASAKLPTGVNLARLPRACCRPMTRWSPHCLSSGCHVPSSLVECRVW